MFSHPAPKTILYLTHIMRIFLVILSILKAVNAQTSSACGAPTATVSDYDSSASLTSECTYLSGSLEISGYTSEDIVLDGLKSIGGDLIYNGTIGGTDGFTAISSSTLSDIWGELKLQSATYVSSVEFDKLESIGGLDIVSNLALQNLSLPALMYSRGSMEMSGNFSSVLLPELKTVNGTFKLLSATDFDCSTFDDDNEAGVFPIGGYSCTARNSTTTSSFTTTSTIAQETKRPSAIPPGAVSSVVTSPTPSATQPQNSSSAIPMQAKSNTGLTTKEKLAIGIGVGLSIVFVMTAGLFWWRIRASHKKHEDRISRVPIFLTGDMLLDNVPERPRDQQQSRFGDPRYSGLSYHEVHTELEELHELEKTRPLTRLEKERERWLMEHMFLRAEPEEPVQRAEMEG